VFSYGVLLLEMCLRKEPSCTDDKDELVCLVEDEKLRVFRKNPLNAPP
jgi:hypothetical protein